MGLGENPSSRVKDLIKIEVVSQLTSIGPSNLVEEIVCLLARNAAEDRSKYAPYTPLLKPIFSQHLGIIENELCKHPQDKALIEPYLKSELGLVLATRFLPLVTVGIKNIDPIINKILMNIYCDVGDQAKREIITDKLIEGLSMVLKSDKLISTLLKVAAGYSEVSLREGSLFGMQGGYIPSSNSIILGGTEVLIKGVGGVGKPIANYINTLVHEHVHLALAFFANNDCNPYAPDDLNAKQHFNLIKEKIITLFKSNKALIFNLESYPPEEHDCEIPAHYAGAIAELAVLKGGGSSVFSNLGKEHLLVLEALRGYMQALADQAESFIIPLQELLENCFLNADQRPSTKAVFIVKEYLGGCQISLEEDAPAFIGADVGSIEFEDQGLQIGLSGADSVDQVVL